MRIDTGRYAEILSRLLSSAGQMDPVSELSPEISATFVLESDRPEWAFLSSQRLMCAGLDVSASALLASNCRLRNPTSSNVLGVILIITASSSATWRPTLRLAAGTTDLAQISTAPSVRDTRFVGLPSGALILSLDNAPAVGKSIEQGRVLASTTYAYTSVPLILSPGFALDIGTDDVVNTPISVHLAWRERELAKYERR